MTLLENPNWKILIRPRLGRFFHTSSKKSNLFTHSFWRHTLISQKTRRVPGTCNRRDPHKMPPNSATRQRLY